MFGGESWCSNIFGFGLGWHSCGWWALCLVIMMLMMGLCFFLMMRDQPRVRNAEGTDYTTSDSARGVLDKRYASGEISAAEYEEKKRNLNQT